MRAVTPRYYVMRRYKVWSLLPWWVQNEIRIYGYFTPAPRPMNGSRFRISDWFYSDDSSYPFDDKEMPRYSEVLTPDGIDWKNVRHPWSYEPTNLVRCFHSAKEIETYLYKTLGRVYKNFVKGNTVVMYLPYGGLPLVSVTSKDGKVTIY